MMESLAPKVTILDYGMCNLFNVVRAFEHCGADVTVTEEPEVAAKAERLVVPGVGAFSDSVGEIRRRNLDEALCRFAESGRPMLGVCVGMQILFDSSEEFGNHSGLGIIPGRVVAVPLMGLDGTSLRIPHIGWNHLLEPGGGVWEGTFLAPFSGQSPAMYFVHSFSAVPMNDEDRLADCLYGGHSLCAVVQRENIMATQFHPERSGLTGLNLITRFCQL